MKPTNLSVLAALLSILIPMATAPVGADDEWMRTYVVVNTTETVQRNSEGAIASATVVKESRISARQKVTEISVPDENGNMRLVNRKTETYDSLGGSIVAEEAHVKDYVDPVIVKVTTVVKTPTSTVTTVEIRNELGSLVLVSRTTVTELKPGERTTIVESPDEHGNLVPTATTEQYQEIR